MGRFSTKLGAGFVLLVGGLISNVALSDWEADRNAYQETLKGLLAIEGSEIKTPLSAEAQRVLEEITRRFTLEKVRLGRVKGSTGQAAAHAIARLGVGLDVRAALTFSAALEARVVERSASQGASFLLFSAADAMNEAEKYGIPAEKLAARDRYEALQFALSKNEESKVQAEAFDKEFRAGQPNFFVEGAATAMKELLPRLRRETSMSKEFTPAEISRLGALYLEFSTAIPTLQKPQLTKRWVDDTPQQRASGVQEVRLVGLVPREAKGSRLDRTEFTLDEWRKSLTAVIEERAKLSAEIYLQGADKIKARKLDLEIKATQLKIKALDPGVAKSERAVAELQAAVAEKEYVLERERNLPLGVRSDDRIAKAEAELSKARFDFRTKRRKIIQDSLALRNLEGGRAKEPASQLTLLPTVSERGIFTGGPLTDKGATGGTSRRANLAVMDPNQQAKTAVREFALAAIAVRDNPTAKEIDQYKKALAVVEELSRNSFPTGELKGEALRQFNEYLKELALAGRRLVGPKGSPSEAAKEFENLQHGYAEQLIQKAATEVERPSDLVADFRERAAVYKNELNERGLAVLHESERLEKERAALQEGTDSHSAATKAYTASYELFARYQHEEGRMKIVLGEEMPLEAMLREPERGPEGETPEARRERVLNALAAKRAMQQEVGKGGGSLNPHPPLSTEGGQKAGKVAGFTWVRERVAAAQRMFGLRPKHP